MKIIFLALFISTLAYATDKKGVNTQLINLNPRMVRIIDSTINSVCYTIYSPRKSYSYNRYGRVTDEFSTGDDISISCVKLNDEKLKRK